MSLQVWLPLTKDLRQQGLSNAEVINNGATYSSTGGKLGGCYSFNRSTPTYLKVSNPITAAENGVSITFWINLPSNASGNNQIVHIGNGPGWGNNRCTVFVRSGASYLIFSLSGGSDATSTQYTLVSSSLPLNTWTHVACVYSMGKAKIYLNGVLDHEYTISIIPSFNNTSYIGVGAAPNAGEGITCSLNDVRVYDHCLSPMEVKQISQGLVLHYPLNRNGWGQENLFSWVNNDTSITLNNYQNTGSFTQFNNSLTFDPSTTVGEKYTISFYARSPNGTTSLMVYNSNSNPQYFNFGSSPQLTSSLGTEWEYFTRTITNAQYSGTGTPSTNTNIWKRIEIYAPNKMGVQVKHIKVEKGEKATPWCPNSSDALATAMGLNSTTEYDCSGFGNNGTRTGTFTWTSDTPKYAVSTIINSSKIQCITNPITGDDPIFSIGFWFKLKSNISYIAYADLVSFSSSSYSNQPFRLEICGNPVGNDIYWFRGPSGNTGGFKINTSSLVRDTWYHTMLVSEGNKQYSYYINGIKTGTYNGSANSWIPTNIFSIGDGQAGAFNISDARIYATALSADGIKSLYESNKL